MNSDVFDSTLALESVGGDRSFLSEVAGLFQAAWPTLWSDIRAGLAVGNLCAVERSAHLVQAAARNVSARSVYEAAQELEQLARHGALEASQVACEALQREVERLTPYLAPLQNFRSAHTA